MTKRVTLEAEIQRQILAEIGAEPDLLILKNSVGVAQHFDDKTGKSWKVPYGLGKGSADLVSMLRVGPCLGAWVCLEVKVPGEDAEPHQAENHEQWRQFGALVYVVHSAREARMAIETARLAIGLWMADWAKGAAQ